MLVLFGMQMIMLLGVRLSCSFKGKGEDAPHGNCTTELLTVGDD